MPLVFNGQFRQIYLDNDSTNDVKHIQFISASEGYVSFEHWIGYTQDSGHSFQKKYITISNVDYNGFAVNLTFGFSINGVHIFSRDSILVYGHYGFVPSILFSANGGNSFKLLYNSTLTLTTANKGIEQMLFPGGGNTGYAVELNRILKTTDRGQSWFTAVNDSNTGFFDIQFQDALSGYALSGDKLLKTINGGSSWQNISVPAGTLRAMSFTSPSKGWLNVNYALYRTTNSGNTWQLIPNQQSYPAGYPMKFINDSTGYFSGPEYNIYKTTDSGNTWEPLPRDNNFSFYYYTHSNFFFADQYNIWAGGAHGFLEHTNNGGGLTLPVAFFNTDLSTLNTDATVRFNNFSKTGYQYTWLKNSLPFSTNYNASYVSDRTTIDTIQLVVQKGSKSDTASAIIDTRVNTQHCFATFQSQVDTASVSFIPGYQTIGVKHYWEFGDGEADSINTSPVHRYTAIGSYTVKHRVFNTIDRCGDSTTAVVVINRLQNCLTGDFTYQADSFYTNMLSFRPTLDSSRDNNVRGLISWNFGDGTPVATTNTHGYDSARYYNVCLIVKNTNTGCSNSICKPVLVQMNNTCNGNFVIRTDTDSAGRLLPLRTAVLNGALHSQKTGKRNSWVVDDRDSVVTGNTETLRTNFFRSAFDNYFSVNHSNDCGFGNNAEICIDSLNKKITHTVYDSLSGCSNSVTKYFIVPRLADIFIKVIPDPVFSWSVSIDAYTMRGTDTIPFTGTTTWRIMSTGTAPPGEFYYYFQQNYKFPYVFTRPGDYTIALSSPSCPYNTYGVREVYYVHYIVPPMACPVYPPEFKVTVPNAADPMTLRFADTTFYQNGQLNNKLIWYFGDGDSSSRSPALHSYTVPGNYMVSLKYSNANGCSKTVGHQVTAMPACYITAGFSMTRDTLMGNQIQFTNKRVTTPDSISYRWYFGNGDSSIQQSPLYTYKRPGSYTALLVIQSGNFCTSRKDTSFIITAADSCNLQAGFKAVILQNKVSFVNSSKPQAAIVQSNWHFGDGAESTLLSPVHDYAKPGRYTICMTVVRDAGCSSSLCDSVIIKDPRSKVLQVNPNPVNNSFALLYNAQQAGQITVRIFDNRGRMLITVQRQAVVGLNSYTLSAINLKQGYYVIRVTSSSGLKETASFVKTG